MAKTPSLTDIMYETLLREIGVGLFGSHWQAALSQELRVSDRTFRRWLSGKEEPPRGVFPDLMRLAMRRRSEVDSVVERLEGFISRRQE